MSDNSSPLIIVYVPGTLEHPPMQIRVPYVDDVKDPVIGDVAYRCEDGSAPVFLVFNGKEWVDKENADVG